MNSITERDLQEFRLHSVEGWYLDTEYKQRITSIPANSSEDYTVYARWELCPKETTNGKEGIYEAGDGNWYYFKNDTIQTVFSHSICYRVNRKTVVDNTSEKL